MIAFLAKLSPALAQAFTFNITADTGTSVTWTRRYTPGWAIFLAILGLIFLLLGLLFLLVKRENVLVTSLSERDDDRATCCVPETLVEQALAQRGERI
jgi:hypothetical protein